MTCFSLLFLMRILVTCIFFQSCFSQRLLVARLLIGLFPRLLWAILQPLSPAKIVNTMNLSKNRIQLFILSSRNFLNSFSKSFFFCVFPKVVFLKTYWLRSGLYLLIWKSKLVGFWGKARFQFHTFATWDINCFTYVSVSSFCFLWEFFFSMTNG